MDLFTRPTVLEASSLLNQMMNLDSFEFGFNEKFWYSLPVPERTFFCNQVLVTDHNSYEAIFNGWISPPEVFENIRSARLSTRDVEEIKEKSRYEILSMVRRRKGRRSSTTYQKVQTWGESKEQEVLAKYSEFRHHEFDLRTCGHVLNPNLPVFISQVNGLAFKDGYPCHLIEIKSIEFQDLEKTYGMYEDCFRKRGFGYSINPRCHVYCHLQLSMLLLNMKKSELVIYNPKEKKISHVIRTDRDDTYLAVLLVNILTKYITMILPEFTRSMK